MIANVLVLQICGSFLCESRDERVKFRSRRMDKFMLRQILVAIPVFLLKFMMGIGCGWIAPMLNTLRNSPEAAFTSQQCAWIASGHYISRGLSPIFAVLSIDRLGRNMTLIIASFLSFVMWIAVYYSKMVYVHYAIRFTFGLSVGINDAVAGIYMAENCSPNVRGIFSGIQTAAFYLGEVLEFLAAAYLSYEWVAITNAVFGFIVIMSMFMLREPAHYLIMKGKLKKAEKNYDYLHNLQNAKTKLHFEEIQSYVNDTMKKKLSLQTLRSVEVLKSMRIVLIINFLSLAGGFTAVNSFITMAVAGSENISASQLTVLFGIAQLFCILLSMIFLDTFNRRTLYLLSTALTAILHAATAALYCLSSNYQIPYYNWILFTLLTTFSCVYAMFVSPLLTTVMGELLPQNVKSLGSNLCVVSSSLGAFIGAKIFLPVSDLFGVHTNFILFSFVNLSMFLYIYFDLIETKGKTLVDIQRELRGEDCKKEVIMDTHL